jgi:hypothetical protein
MFFLEDKNLRFRGTVIPQTKLYMISVQKLTSVNSVLRTKNMTPLKPHKSKFQAEKSCQVSGLGRVTAAQLMSAC